LLDKNWVSFNLDPVKLCLATQVAPPSTGRIVAIVSDSAADCASADWRARVDTHEVKSWITRTIRDRFGHWEDD
jgi:hypothetical protein